MIFCSLSAFAKMAIYKKIEEGKDLWRYIIVAYSKFEDSLRKSFVDTRGMSVVK